MAIGQPDFLLIFNESSGTAVTNYGSQATSYAIMQGSSPTNYTWNQGSGSYDGYLDLKTRRGANMPYLQTAATAPGTTLETVNFAVGFELDGYDDEILVSYLSTASGALNIVPKVAVGSGNFDLFVRFNTDSGGGTNQVISDLSYGVFYILSASFNCTSANACVSSYKLNSGLVSTVTDNLTLQTLPNAWPNICAAAGSAVNGGIDGRLHFWAFQRGGTAWDSTDLATINSNPKSAFGTWWPGGSSAAIPKTAGLFGGVFSRIIG